jgi:hypothetical protein
MSRWGFDPGGIDEWDRENGVTRIIDAATLSPSALRRLLKKKERNGR